MKKLDRYPPVRQLDAAMHVDVVREIFSTIFRRYDFLNHFLSLRRDVTWRRFAARKMIFSRTRRLLDLACGTGDLLLSACREHDGIAVTGVDFVYPMVKVAQEKFRKAGYGNIINFIQADATRLPFPENYFDVTAMAFGIRNIPQKEAALNEMIRVTLPGGQIVVLEMARVEKGLFRFPYTVYLRLLLPFLAKFFTRNAAAYHYLADSIINFPSPRDFAALMKSMGIVDVKTYPLTFGITWLFVGRKPDKPFQIPSAS